MENSASTPAAPKRRLRWYQFSLRTLLVGVTLFAFACSWFAVKMRQAKKQKETVEAIEKLGGTVHYNFFDDGTGNMIQPAPIGPVWLRNLLGHDFFDQLEYINLGMSHTTDAGLKHLCGLSHLRILVLNNTEITNAGLECLQELKQLEDLFLAQTQITDAGLEHLKRMKQLQRLGLPRQISDAGMTGIQQALPKCKISR